MEPFLNFFKTQAVVGINDARIDYLANFIVDNFNDFLAVGTPFVSPLIFDDDNQEINFLSVRHLLSVGSQYEFRSIEANQDSLSSVVLFGVLGAYLSQSDLNAEFMRTCKVLEVAKLFSLPVTEKANILSEDESLLSVISMEKKGGLYDYGVMLTNALNQTGKELVDNGCLNLSLLLSNYLTGSDNNEHSIDSILKSIAQKVAYFDDRHFVSVLDRSSGAEDMSELCFFKNLHRLIFDIYILCKHKADSGQWSNSTSTSWSPSSCLLTEEDIHNLPPSPSCQGISKLFQCGILFPLAGNNSNNPKDSVCNESTNPGGGAGAETITTVPPPDTATATASTHTVTDQDSVLSVGKEIVTDKSAIANLLTSGGVGNEVSIRAGAVVACYMVHEAVQNRLQLRSQQQSSSNPKSGVDFCCSPFKISLYLDEVKLENINIENNSIEVSKSSDSECRVLFVPKGCCDKW